MSASNGMILLGERRSIDKTGLMKITRRVLFDDYDSAVTGAYAEVDQEYDGALFVGASGQGDEAGSWVCQFEYEKAVEGSGDGGETGVVEELDFSMKQDPIQAHPDFAALKDPTVYGWDEAAKAFPAKLSSGEDSPVYGTSEFLNFSCVYRRTATVTEIPPSIFENIGSIDEAGPPFDKLIDPAAGDERTWLYMAPKVSTRGNSFQIAQEWMLSGFGVGWIEAIYSLDSLQVLETGSN